MHPENFQTERLQIRKIEPSDDQIIFSTYASNPISTRYISWLTHKSIEETREYLKMKLQKWDNGSECVYVMEDKKENLFVGSVGFVNENGRVFIGYILNPEAEGRGYASEATKCITDYLKTRNEFYRVWACVAVENKASARVLEKAGLIKEGIIYDWIDFPNLKGESRDCYFFYLPKD